MPAVVSVGDVVVIHTITGDNDHALVALDRSDGAVMWDFDPDETFYRVHTLGSFVFATLTVGETERTVALDAATGRARDVSTLDAAAEICSRRVYDPVTLEVVGDYCHLGYSPSAYVARVGETVVLLSPLDLEPVSDPIPIEDVAEQRQVMIVGDLVFTHNLSALNVLTTDGERVLSIPDPGEVFLWPAGVGSDVIVVEDLVEFGVDVNMVDEVLWERSDDVSRFGVVDGEVYGLAAGDSTTEVFSLDTGDTRCVIDDEVFNAENGFYSAAGVAYDFDCTERWGIDASIGADMSFVDGGVLVVESSEEATTLRFWS